LGWYARDAYSKQSAKNFWFLALESPAAPYSIKPLSL
jgi:hypothetical protein